jgi:hypothetical protein
LNGRLQLAKEGILAMALKEQFVTDGAAVGVGVILKLQIVCTHIDSAGEPLDDEWNA